MERTVERVGPLAGVRAGIARVNIIQSFIVSRVFQSSISGWGNIGADNLRIFDNKLISRI